MSPIYLYNIYNNSDSDIISYVYNNNNNSAIIFTGSNDYPTQETHTGLFIIQ